MKTTERGQVLLLVAFFMILIICIVIVVSDLIYVFLKQQELDRIADCAAKSGMIIVGDIMMTQAVEQAGYGISGKGENEVGGSDPGAGHMENNSGDLTDVCSNESSRATLVAPPLQTAIAAKVIDQISDYHLDGEPTYQPDIGVDYPYHYSSSGSDLRLYLSLEQQIDLTFPSPWGDPGLVIYGESEQVIYCP